MLDFDSPTVCTLNLDIESASRDDKRDLFVIRRLSLDKETSDRISHIFNSASKNYTENPVDYSPDYHLDRDQVFMIRNFPFPSKMMNAFSNSAGLDSQKYLDDDIKAVVVANKDCTSVAFQLIDKSHHLKNKLCIIHDGFTFQSNKKAGLILRDSISCLYQDGTLYFKSYRGANSIFDLNQYLELASDEAIKTFMSCPFISFEDSDHFKKQLTQSMRRNITLIEKAGVMDLDVDKVKEVIIQNNLPIQFENNKITVPKDKNELKKVMNFFTEKMFITLFSKKVCVTNSVQTLSEAP